MMSEGSAREDQADAERQDHRRNSRDWFCHGPNPPYLWYRDARGAGLLTLNFTMADQKLQIIPLGGLGEFGMNCMALRYGDDIIVIDAGMMFPDAELLGVDIVTPDFTYLEENREHVRGLILTHGHEDHIGGIPFLLAQMNIPVYGTAFTLALVERRLEEHQMLDQANLHKIKPGGKLTLGPFSIEFIHVTHSIVSCVLLAITTPLGVIIHTGDYKVDPTPTDNELFDLHTLDEYCKPGVWLLHADSTHVARP